MKPQKGVLTLGPILYNFKRANLKRTGDCWILVEIPFCFDFLVFFSTYWGDKNLQFFRFVFVIYWWFRKTLKKFKKEHFLSYSRSWKLEKRIWSRIFLHIFGRDLRKKCEIYDTFLRPFLHFLDYTSVKKCKRTFVTHLMLMPKRYCDLLNTIYVHAFHC